MELIHCIEFLFRILQEELNLNLQTCKPKEIHSKNQFCRYFYSLVFSIVLLFLVNVLLLFIILRQFFLRQIYFVSFSYYYLEYMLRQLFYILKYIHQLSRSLKIETCNKQCNIFSLQLFFSTNQEFNYHHNLVTCAYTGRVQIHGGINFRG